VVREHILEDADELEHHVIKDAPALERFFYTTSIGAANAWLLAVGISELQLGSALFCSMGDIRLLAADSSGVRRC
jgi:hypothetical protein